jgi:hypothetical protein
MDGGGWLWMFIALGLIALGVAIASNIRPWRDGRRDSLKKARSDAKTRRNYREGG